MHSDRQLSKNSKSYKANLSLPARAFTFHSTLCHIKFSIWHHCNERGDERELQLLSPSHTRGILISAPSSCSQRLDGKAWLWNITEPPCLPKQTAELCQKGDWPQCRETTGQHAAVQESVSLVSVCRQKLFRLAIQIRFLLLANGITGRACGSRRLCGKICEGAMRIKHLPGFSATVWLLLKHCDTRPVSSPLSIPVGEQRLQC